MSLKSVTNACVIAVVAGALTSACGQLGGGEKPLGSYKKRVSATIFLIGPDAANCKTAKVSPYRLQPKNNELADWTVVDLCGITDGYKKLVRVTFTPTSASNCDGEPIVPNNYVEGNMNLFSPINNKCKPEETFTYTVSVGGGPALSDPELEIAM